MCMFMLGQLDEINPSFSGPIPQKACWAPWWLDSYIVSYQILILPSGNLTICYGKQAHENWWYLFEMVIFYSCIELQTVYVGELCPISSHLGCSKSWVTLLNCWHGRNPDSIQVAPERVGSLGALNTTSCRGGPDVPEPSRGRRNGASDVTRGM